MEKKNEGIKEDIEEAKRAEEALEQERDRIEAERLKLLKNQQDVNRARVIALRQPKKKVGGIHSPNESGNESRSEYRS